MRYKVSNICQLSSTAGHTDTQTINGITFTNNKDGSWTINGTATSGCYKSVINLSTTSGHKLLFCGNLSTNPSDVFQYIQPLPSGQEYYDMGVGVIFTTASVAYYQIVMFVRSGTTVNNDIIKPQLFDLTEMYGAGNEPTTVAQFRQDFPDEYYEYSPECWKRIRELRYVTETRNLFEESLKTGNAGAFSATTKRNFEENVWYIGLTRNNYNAPHNIGSYELKYNYIAYRNAVVGYGVARAFKVSPNTNYILSYKGTVAQAEIGYGYYDSEGKLLSHEDSRASFTTPDNCKWLTIIFTMYKGSNERYVMNLQLEEGSTATSYQPYGYLGMRQGKYIQETKNLCDFTTLFNDYTIDNQFVGYGFLQVELSVKPNTQYTLSRANSERININHSATYLGMDNVSSASHVYETWLNHDGLSVYCVQHITITSSSAGKLWIFFSSSVYDAYKNGQNPFGYLQLEEGSTATSYQPYKHISFN